MLMIPANYQSKLSLIDTQKAIKKLKDFFETQLAYELDLIRVSAPLFVKPETGLNDQLSGVEEPVSFIVNGGEKVEIVHSLAKWKRFALYRYQIPNNKGVYTDMNAIRKDEILDHLHSYYVDQWDWEKVIADEDRHMDTLIYVVKQIYKVFKITEDYITKEYPVLNKKLPEEIYFITSQELENMYPDLSSEEREHAICREKRAVFILQIGAKLKSGKPHGDRSPDYDDWLLNGDLLFYSPIHDEAIELSSMGIRVNQERLLAQLKETNTLDRLTQDYHQAIIRNLLPQTIGGGIGQSRLCLFFLDKAHIGEVQVSLWPRDMVEVCERSGIELL